MPNETDNLIQYGTIVAIDLSGKALVRVQIDDRVTDWLPYQMIANKHIKIWIPPQIGEQVEVHSPYGETDSGSVTGSMYNKECKEPTDANAHTTIIEWSNGARVAVDVEANTMNILNPGDVSITAPIVKINGSLTVSGTITDEKGSLTSHVHSGVMAGGSNTGVRP